MSSQLLVYLKDSSQCIVTAFPLRAGDDGNLSDPTGESSCLPTTSMDDDRPTLHSDSTPEGGDLATQTG